MHFDIAVVFFALLNLCLGNHYSLLEYTTALVGWNSVGNSTWFIFASLCLYVICYISGAIACVLTDKNDKQKIFFAIGIVAGSMIYILIVREFKQPVYYNTVLSFAVGSVFALVKKYYDEWLKSIWAWLGAVAFLAIMYGVGILFFSYNFRAPVLTLLIFTITMRIEVKNPVLNWLGNHIFSIYILQRIPMIALSAFGVNKYQYLFIVLSWCITFVISWAFDKFLVLLDRKLKLA